MQIEFPIAQGGGIPIIAKDGSINGGMPGAKGGMPGTGGKLGGSCHTCHLNPNSSHSL